MNGKYGLNKREIADLLRDKDINPTTQRIEIAHLLFEKPQHLSAEEIRQRMNSEYEKCSQATVYNTLRLFVEKAVVRELIFSSDRIYYDSNIVKHLHFVDVDSGQTLQIIRRDGTTVNLDMSGTKTVQDVIDRINDFEVFDGTTPLADLNLGQGVPVGATTLDITRCDGSVVNVTLDGDETV